MEVPYTDCLCAAEFVIQCKLNLYWRMTSSNYIYFISFKYHVIYLHLLFNRSIVDILQIKLSSVLIQLRKSWVFRVNEKVTYFVVAGAFLGTTLLFEWPLKGIWIKLNKYETSAKIAQMSEINYFRSLLTGSRSFLFAVYMHDFFSLNQKFATRF